MNADYAAIVAELEAWEAETGQRLPMSAQECARVEMTGRYVDFETGKIVNPLVLMDCAIEIGGENAGNVAQKLQDAFNDGRLNLAIVNLLRDELRGTPGDWQVVKCCDTSAEVHP